MAKKKTTKKTTKKKTKGKKTTKKKAESKPEKTKAIQPEINIGMIGHVDHGKTTLVQVLSGKWADTHSEEIKRGITIRLGYADVTFYEYPDAKDTDAYGVTPENKTGQKGKLLRKVSLIDAPGHESLMATMLCGANIMDGALLLVSATEPCPQPQTREHLQALDIVGVEKLIVIQNKIDLISEEQATKNHEQIKAFLEGTRYEDAPIIPMSAKHAINLDMLIKTIEDLIPTPKRDLTKPPLMFVARSFDINKPGATPDKMLGGVLGGALRYGKLTSNQDIVILPGHEVTEKNQQVWKPIKTKITSLMTGGKQTDEVHPGGSIAAMTTLDPNIVKSDKLVGSVIGEEGKTPPVWYDLTLETHLLDRVVGAKDKLVVDPIKKGEVLMLNVNAAATVGVVQELGKDTITCKLKRPICAEVGSRVTMSRRLGQRWRLIGYSIIAK